MAGEWRDPRFYARLRGIDRAGLMWEWLRRDPGYIAWYTRASTATRGTGTSGLAPGDDPVLWGIHFRRAAGGRDPGCAAPLASRF